MEDIKQKVICELDRRMGLLRAHQDQPIQENENPYSGLNQSLSKVMGAPLLEELGDIKDFVKNL